MRKTLVTIATLLGFAGALLAPGLAAAKDEKAPVYPSKAKSMTISGQLQFRYEHVEKAEGDEAAVSSFNWKRARLTFAGDISDNLYYQWRWQADDLPVKWNSTDKKTEGAFGFSTTFLGYHLPANIGDLEIGRFDVECTPRSNSSRQPLPERPMHIEENRAGSQLGVHYSNEWFNERLSVDAGMYNGNGDHNVDYPNENAKFMYTVRVKASPNKKFPFNAQTDIRHTDWGVGFLGGYWTSINGLDGTKDKAKVDTFGGALYLKGKGLYITGEMTRRKSDSSYTPARNDFTAKGWNVDAAYALPLPIKGMFIEPAFRYESYKNPSTRVAAENQDMRWTTAGLNWYISNYDATIQTAYIWKKEKGDSESIDNDTWQIQGNLYF